MTSTDDLAAVLKKLRLSGVLQTLPLRVQQAVDENLDQKEFLYRLLHDEVERRDGKQLELRLNRANFEHERTIEEFDFLFNPGVPRSKIIELATCGFVDRHEVVLLLGATGVGKSHLSQTLGGLRNLGRARTAKELAEALEVSVTRRVSNALTFSLEGRLFEVCGRHLAGKKIQVVLDAFNGEPLHVRFEDAPVVFGRCDTAANSRRRRAPAEAPTPAPTVPFDPIAALLQKARQEA